MRKIIIAGALVFLACSGKPAPKDAVFDFVDAVLTSDSLRVVKNLDVDTYVRSLMTKMSPEDSARVMKEYPARTIASLLSDGDVRRRWQHSQIIVNQEFRKDGNAEVEVTFIDRATNNALYTRMQLHQQPTGAWRVTYFR
jgi:PBP1b-binding outer membrane lipoprotein LpoB